MFETTSRPRYQHEAFGIWGNFNTPSGRVTFLETKARLGRSDTDAESRLTGFLKPVREVLDTKDMDFNQLLQRDLDDHRVATELVPYLLHGTSTGPAFFPPIVAALLPFAGQEPQVRFPPRDDLAAHREDSFGWLQGYVHGEAFSFESLATEGGADHPLKLGRLRWNNERTQMVVLDGQHRSMALLAIFRTLNDRWEGEGDKYKFFYERTIKAHLDAMTKEQVAQLDRVELPVTLLWFPEVDDQQVDHQKAARKLFVDVNKNARTPSPARLLLLDDTSLTAIFTRRVLNELRAKGTDTLPITAVEYDHPDRDQAAVAKWSTVTNVGILQACIHRTVFGPPDYIDDVGSTVRRGRESKVSAAGFMRETLEVRTLLESTLDCDGEIIEREDLSDARFPRKQVPELERRLMETWGGFVVRMLSEVLPYRKHGEALQELANDWNPIGSGRLARDAMLEGVGMYWTLRDSHNHFQDRNARRRRNQEPTLPKPDVVKAWDDTEAKRDDFEKTRARHYLEGTGADVVQQSREAYGVFSTYACQVGLAMACRSFAKRLNLNAEEVPGFTEAVIGGINAALTQKEGIKAGRRRFLSRTGVRNPINLLGKMDTPFAFYFRYLWLELLAAPEAAEHLAAVDPERLVIELAEKARVMYLQHLVDEKQKDLHRLEPAWSKAELREEARSRAVDDLRNGLSYWFGIGTEGFDAWLDGAFDASPAADATEDEAPVAEDQEDEELEGEVASAAAGEAALEAREED